MTKGKGSRIRGAAWKASRSMGKALMPGREIPPCRPKGKTCWRRGLLRRGFIGRAHLLWVRSARPSAHATKYLRRSGLIQAQLVLDKAHGLPAIGAPAPTHISRPRGRAVADRLVGGAAFGP